MLKNNKDLIIKQDFCLADISTIKIGGNAKYYIECKSLKTLKKVIVFCLKNNIKYKIVGGCSNLLFDSKGFNGAIIRYSKNKISKYKEYIICSSGIPLSILINFAMQNNLSGLENYVGIPCYVGGAVRNNIGSFNKEIYENLVKVKYLSVKNKNNKIQFKIINKKISKFDFSYRKCNFLSKNDIILEIKLKLQRLNKELISNNINFYYSKKKKNQPLENPSLGSIFLRAENVIPAKIIDDLNLKGKRVGGVEVSTKHSGFFVNVNAGNSEDMTKLIEFVKSIVKEKFDVDLKTEIEYVPF